MNNLFFDKFSDLLMDVLGTKSSPDDIHGQIKKAVEEIYYYHKHHCSRAYELLSLLNNNHTDSNFQYISNNLPPTTSKDWNDFWQEYHYSEENKKTYDEMVADGYTMTADGFWIKEHDQDTNKWTLPVELDGLTGDCFVNLPDDLLGKVGWKENDQLEWIDRGDGSFELRKI
jgi:hypothetical protein